MTAPLPLAPREHPYSIVRRPGLRILPAPDPEPPFEPDPYWERPRLAAVPEQLPIDWANRARSATGTAVPPAGPPGARHAAWLLINGYLEVLRGQRPVSQLTESATRTGADHLREVKPQPDRRIRLFRLRVSEPLPGRAEVVVLLTDESESVWALAVQLVHLGNAWRCGHFQML